MNRQASINPERTNSDVKYVLFREVFPFGKYPAEVLGEFPTKPAAYAELDRIKNADPFSNGYMKLFVKEYPKSYVLTKEFPDCEITG